MNTINIIPYHEEHIHAVLADFEEMVQGSMLVYSMRHLVSAGITSRENFKMALAKAMQVCNYAGINTAYHFRQVYVFDAEADSLDTDWWMSKQGFKLIIMQYPHINERLARWLWELSDIERGK
jgi:hypothetical protein